MRGGTGLALGLLTAGVVAVGVWLWAPASLPNPVTSEALAQGLSKSLPFDVTWESMAVSKGVSTISLDGCEIRATADAPPTLAVSRVVLQLVAGSLATGELRIDRIKLEEPRLEIERTPAGWKPWDPFRVEQAGNQESAGKPAIAIEVASAKTEEVTAAGWNAAPGSFTVDRGTLVLTDTSRDPSMVWGLEDVKVEGNRDSANGGYAVEGSGRFSPGGELEATGTLATDGSYALDFILSDLVIASLARYSASLLEVEAPVSGTLSIKGVGSTWHSLQGQFRSPNVSLQIQEMKARGALVLDVRLEPNPAGGVLGEFDLDATEASLVVAESYRKAVGSPARLKGTFVITPDGKAELDQVHLAIRNKRARPAGPARETRS